MFLYRSLESLPSFDMAMSLNLSTFYSSWISILLLVATISLEVYSGSGENPFGSLVWDWYYPSYNFPELLSIF